MGILKEREGKEYDHATESYIEKKDAYGKTDTVPTPKEIGNGQKIKTIRKKC